jgi:uncharacterized membrane protein YdjX (TVP38/TMEM64 family)
MKKQITKNKKEIFILLSSVLLVMYLIIEVLPFLTSPKVIAFVEDAYPFGSLVVILFISLTQVVAPLPGSPGVIVSFAVFGWKLTRLYVYLGSLISASVNYYVAHNLGRKWVKRLAGKKSLKQIDEFAEAEGVEVLIISRLLGFPLFDYISYAAGFTNISFTKYFIITAIFGGVANFLYMLLYKNLDFTSSRGFITWYGTLLLIFPFMGYLIKKYVRGKGKTKKN